MLFISLSRPMLYSGTVAITMHPFCVAIFSSSWWTHCVQDTRARTILVGLFYCSLYVSHPFACSIVCFVGLFVEPMERDLLLRLRYFANSEGWLCTLYPYHQPYPGFTFGFPTTIGLGLVNVLLADAFVVSKVNAATPSQLDAIRLNLSKITPGKPLLYADSVLSPHFSKEHSDDPSSTTPYRSISQNPFPYGMVFIPRSACLRGEIKCKPTFPFYRNPITLVTVYFFQSSFLPHSFSSLQGGGECQGSEKS